MTAPAVHLEREVKLAVWPGFELPALDGLIEGLTAMPASEHHLEAAYFDTPDLRMVRSGVTLRHRSGEGWTLKLPEAQGDTDTLSRRELTVSTDDAAVPPELARLVTAWVRGAELVPVARLHTWRRRIVLTDAEGAMVAEIVDDDVSVVEGQEVVLRFREVEVEAGERTPEALLDALVAQLRAAGAGPADSIPKVKRALGPSANEPPELSGERDDDRSAAWLIESGLRASVRRLLRHDVGARMGDVEGVHQARVATRRLRSDLRTFAPVLDQAWATHLRAELKWLAAALGEVRDADVLLERLRHASGRLDAADAAGASTLLERLQAERSTARGRLLAVLDERRYALLLDQLVDSVERTGADTRPAEWLVADAYAPAGEVVPPLVERPWKRLRKAARAAGPDSSDDDLHEVRIRAKRCRYAIEVALPLGGKPASKLAKAVARLQEVLGDHHDAVVAEAWLRSAVPNLDAASSMVAGQLIAGERAAADAYRGAWPDAWRRADKRKLRAWLTT